MSECPLFILSLVYPHDYVGGNLIGLHDEQGNIKQGMSGITRYFHDRIAEVAILPSLPFALAEQFPLAVWQAISVILKAAK